MDILFNLTCKKCTVNKHIYFILGERRIVPQGQASQVAFHAHLSNNVQNLGIHQAIHFDKVLLNEGNGRENSWPRFPVFTSSLGPFHREIAHA